MRNLESSSKKLHVVQTAIQLITAHGFHNTGVDLITKETKIAKGTLYNYFHSKEHLIEMCIAFQKKPAQRRSAFYHLLKPLLQFKR